MGISIGLVFRPYVTQLIDVCCIVVPSGNQRAASSSASYRYYGSDPNVEASENALGRAEHVGEREALLVAVPWTDGRGGE
jgi:hypothetical protein